MPFTVLENQDESVPAGGSISEPFGASAANLTVQLEVTGGDADSINVRFQGRMADWMPWSDIDPPKESTGSPSNIRGIPPWKGLSPGDVRGPTILDGRGVPEIRLLVENTGTTEATVSVVARSANDA